GNASSAVSSAGASIPAAIDEALAPPGSTTVTRAPRRCSSAAVHRPSAPAPRIRTSGFGEAAMALSIDRWTGHGKSDDAAALLGRETGRAGRLEPGLQRLVLGPQGLGQAVAEPVVEGRNQGGLLGPHLGVH